MESILKNLKTLPNSEAIITDYQNDIKLCKKAGEKETDCIKLVDLKYTRKFPVLKDLVYPWVNYDWDYTTFVDNNYNKGKTGATDSPSLGGLFDDMDAMVLNPPDEVVLVVPQNGFTLFTIFFSDRLVPCFKIICSDCLRGFGRKL